MAYSGLIAQIGDIEMTTSKLGRFTEEMARYFYSSGHRIQRWYGSKRSTANLLELRSSETDVVFYVKDKSDSPGFWGLNENQLYSLESSGIPWSVILLVGSDEHGYLIGADQVIRSIEDNLWSRSESDFKIHEGNQEIPIAHRFESFSQLFSKLKREFT